MKTAFIYKSRISNLKIMVQIACIYFITLNLAFHHKQLILIYLQYKQMRFILRYKYGILQTKTERIDVNFCENTTQLIEYLEKRLRQNKNMFIVNFKRGKNHLRIIPGWTLEQYGLKQGCELHIELIQIQKEDDKKNSHINNRYLNNVLGFNRFRQDQMEQVKQKVQEQDEEGENFNVRKYLDKQCEKMLKQIQKKNLQGFKEIFEELPQDVPEQYLIEIKQRKISLIDQLGQKGWGAIHYAIFCGSNIILDQLLALDVDVNKCTSDGWLPIQLAIDSKSTEMISKLLEDPNINLNLITSRGAPIHYAAKSGKKQILMQLLEKQIDVTIKDHLGKTAYDVCLDQQCKNMLKKYEQKRESYNQYVRGNLPLSLTTIFRGKILKAKRPFMNLKQRYLLVDPFQGSMIRYQNEGDYPKKPKQVTPLNIVGGVRMIGEEEKSWHMTKQLHYFTIERPNKEIYACKYRHTAQKWVSNLILAVKFANQLQKNSHLISQIKRNQILIEDIEFQQTIKKEPKKRRPIFVNMSRHSSVSNKSNQSAKNKQSENNHNNNNQHINHQNNHNNNIYSNESAYNLKSAQNTNNNHHHQRYQQNERFKKSEPTQANSSTDDQRNQPQTPESRAKNAKAQLESFNHQFNQIANTKVNFASFNIIKVLGSGAFGKVFLVKHIATGQQYALKALKKKTLIANKQLKYAIIEANILKQANNPFIINLHFAFQTPHYLYLALDYCSGRDLSFHLARQVTFSQDESRFYIAQLVLAIEHLHEKKIIYRDLKPQNILLDGDGHVKLADFGLSKQVGNDDKTKSFCGSPAYLSPEMLSQKGVGKQSDLYGIGTVLYEFLIGEPPYFSDDIPTLYRNIKQGKLKFPKNISQQAKSLILGLLERDPKKRLGSGGMHEIKKHPFFNSVDWGKISNLAIKPPIRPQLSDSQGSDDQLDVITNKNATKFTDFDYDEQTKKINRLANFSFVRAQ